MLWQTRIILIVVLFSAFSCKSNSVAEEVSPPAVLMIQTEMNSVCGAQPVQPFDSVCAAKPIQVTLQLRNTDSDQIIQTFKTDAQGKMELRIPAGNYQLVTEQLPAFLTADSPAFTLAASQTQQITVRVYSGIQ